MGILAWAIGESGRRNQRFRLAGRRLGAGAALAALALLSAAAPGSAQTRTWSVVPSASPRIDNQLNSVSCVSATMCMAVGYYETRNFYFKTLIESWNGTSWSVVPSLNSRDSYLDGVSCVSATACTATGTYYTNGLDKTLIESWNGTRWSTVPSPNPYV